MMGFLIGNMSDADEKVTCDDCEHKTDGSCQWDLAHQNGFAFDCIDFDFSKTYITKDNNGK